MAAISASAAPQQTIPGANRLLAVLLVINLFNYIDRQVLSAVLPRLQRDASILSLDDPNAQLKLGALTSAFMVAYMTLSLLFGWLDGRGVRRWLILGIGVSLWSLASGSSGLATGYWMLLATRCLVGVGEAAYGPVASAMIGDMYSLEHRGRAMALFNLAIPVGSALGFALGGAIAGYFNNWRYAFYFTYIGLALGLLCFFMKDPPRPAAEGERPSYWSVLGELRRNMSFVLCCTGMTAIVFVIGGLPVWIPAFVMERDAKMTINAAVLSDLELGNKDRGIEAVPADLLEKVKDMPRDRVRSFPEMKKELAGVLTPGEAAVYASNIFDAATMEGSPTLTGLNLTFGAILVIGGIVATATGAWIAERLRPRLPGAYFIVIGTGALLALPCYLGFLYAPFPIGWVFVFFTIFFLFLHTGPAFTLLANVTRSRIRATAFAVNILVIHALGDAISPTIIGAIADQSNLQTGFLAVAVMIPIGGLLWLRGAKYLEADTARAA